MVPVSLRLVEQECDEEKDDNYKHLRRQAHNTRRNEYHRTIVLFRGFYSVSYCY
jgi:hypothetical protein